jgi:hypothetical protein
MTNVISLKDFAVQRLRQVHPAFRGTRFLARGSFSGVYSTSQPDRVLKLTTDSSHVAYLTDGCAPSGVHKPVLLRNYGEVGTTERDLGLYLVEVEKLQPVSRGTANGLLARRIIRYVAKNHMYPEELGDISGLTRSLVDFMTDLNWFVAHYDCHTDARWTNFMERADGTLVFSDPVFDKKLYLRLSRAEEYSRFWGHAA